MPGHRLRNIARQLRRDSTPAEEMLWQQLRNRRLGDLKFRRQHRIGSFIVDFYCHAARLVVEVDGGVHRQPDQRAWDDNRTAFLERLGLRVLRFSNQQVAETLPDVLAQIRRAGRG